MFKDCLFKDRFEAGKKLAEKLIKYKNNKDAVVLAIPRGGLQIGSVLSKELNVPLDVFVSKKITLPIDEELAIGAVSQDDTTEIDFEVASEYGVSETYLKKEVEILKKLVKERYTLYTGKKKPDSLNGKIVILCDDGIATGYTIATAANAIKKQKPKKLIITVPVSSKDGIELVKDFADEIVVLEIPEPFYAIGEFYEKFPQVEDEEAIELLKNQKKVKK